MEKWFVIQKGADFNKLAEQFHISPVTARIIRNRGVIGEKAVDRYLNGGLQDLYNPHLLKDADLLTDILIRKIKEQKSIRIIGDYDIDGVMSTYILHQGIRRCGGRVDTRIPDRVKDGYGINDHLIGQAKEAQIDTIITCDNGIAAIDEIAHAKALGMTVLVTDHHEIPYSEEGGKRIYKKSAADAIVNPKQKDCPYPYKELCGAAVAFKVIQLLYEKCSVPREEAWEFLENAAFATVGDVMDLTDENRILVKEGLKRIRHTKNKGMRALILQNKLEFDSINAYHFGFVLGPCINASGRLETAKIALSLFLQEDERKAAEIAAQLVELNAQRKDMTAEGVELAMEAVEKGDVGEKVMVIYLPKVHESLAGIIAGRIREMYHRPTLVLTKSEEGVKGSGRSIEAYSMYEELCKCKEFFSKFGGHPMAAGISMAEKDIEAFRQKINVYCELTDEDFIPKIKIDVPVPAGYPDVSFVRELDLLEPFGKGNIKPQFADKNIGIEHMYIVGKNRNVLKLQLRTESGGRISAVYFGDVEKFLACYREKFGEPEVERALCGRENDIRMSIVYYPEIDAYQGRENVRLVIKNYQ